MECLDCLVRLVMKERTMIKQICFLISLFLASCTCPGIIGDPMTDKEFVTEHGLNVHPQGNWVSKYEIERATEALIINVDGFLPCTYPEEKIRYELQNNVDVYVEQDSFSCRIRQGGSITTTWCLGTYSGLLNRVRYKNEDCIGESAFIHEMLHLLNHQIGTGHDYSHENVRFFGEDESSLEYIINNYIIENYCPSCW